MLVTTYQYDYIAPLTKRYDLVKSKVQNDITKRGQCTKEKKIEAPKMVQKQCNVEWTGIAPMGRLIHPRNIPTMISNEQLDDMLSENQSMLKENQEQQNRFLKILPTAYPNLYDRHKELPKDEFSSRLDNDRMCTTYQIDFCDINEYPLGMYKSQKIGDESGKFKVNNEIYELENKTPSNVVSKDSCEKSYKPLKIPFADSSRFINSGNSSHYRSNIFTKKVKFSEYMDTISKIGCAITKNNIHSHQKCNKRNCRHKLYHACTNLK